MRYCKKCVMPDTRPGIVFDEAGVCQACRNAEMSKQVDWGDRWEQLRQLCNKHRGRKGDYYDCIVTVSGGKDSYFQTHVMKELMGMNPLLVNVANFSWTETGRQNFDNMGDAFGCDILSLHLNKRVARNLFRKAFERLGSPSWYWDKAVYAFPIKVAIDLGIPLIVYGENINYTYGGGQKDETPSAKEQINNDVVKKVDIESWLDKDVSRKDLNAIIYPSKEEIEKAGLEPIYLNYFVPWDGRENMKIAKGYGWKSLGDTGEWVREGYIEDYDQIDAIGYLVHPWLKYFKFGHARATDVACYWIRSGLISRDEGIKLVKEHDRKLDPKALADFLDFTGYTEAEFWEIANRFRNPKLWDKVEGGWKPKFKVGVDT